MGDVSVLSVSWKGMGRAVAQNASGCAAGFINSSSLWDFFFAWEGVGWRGGWGHFSARLCVQHQGKIPEFNQEVDR